MAATLNQFGRLDLAFNNAGVQERRTKLADTDDATYARVFGTNVQALVRCLRHELRAMSGAGGGAIVNNASVSGLRNPNPGLALYAASKAAAISLTRSAAMEYAPHGIRINAVAPGRVVTGMMLGSGIAAWRRSRPACHYAGWATPKRSPPPSPGCYRTRRPMSSATCSAPMAGSWPAEA